MRALSNWWSWIQLGFQLLILPLYIRSQGRRLGQLGPLDQPFVNALIACFVISFVHYPIMAAFVWLSWAAGESMRLVLFVHLMVWISLVTGVQILLALIKIRRSRLS